MCVHMCTHVHACACVFACFQVQVTHGNRKQFIPYFLEKTPRLLFISVLPQCGVYSRAALIRGQRLFEGGIKFRYGHSRVTSYLVPSHVSFQQMQCQIMENMFLSAVSCLQVYLVAHHRKAAKARNRRG